MGMLQDIVDEANTKATNQGDNPLAGKISLTTSLDPEHLNYDSLPKAHIHLGAMDSSNDYDDSDACNQELITDIQVWLCGPTTDIFELIMQLNRAILGIQPDAYLTPIIHDSGFMKEINGAHCWYQLHYQFKREIFSE